MSERWSWCSEYIYCGYCRDIVRRVAKGIGYREVATLGESGSIIAGFGGGLSSNDAHEAMQELVDGLKDKLCHPVRFCALYESAYDSDDHEFIKVPANG